MQMPLVHNEKLARKSVSSQRSRTTPLAVVSNHQYQTRVWQNIHLPPPLLRNRPTGLAHASRRVARMNPWVEELSSRIVPAELIWNGGAGRANASKSISP